MLHRLPTTQVELERKIHCWLIITPLRLLQVLCYQHFVSGEFQLTDLTTIAVRVQLHSRHIRSFDIRYHTLWRPGVLIFFTLDWLTKITWPKNLLLSDVTGPLIGGIKIKYITEPQCTRLSDSRLGTMTGLPMWSKSGS